MDKWPPTFIDPHDPDWVRIPEAAFLAKLCEKTIRRKWRTIGVKFYGQIYISRSRLLRLVDRT